MFTKQKVIDYNNIKSVIDFINREEVDLFRGENMIFATNRMLSYDESCYLSEHLDLIRYKEDRDLLIKFVNEWKFIVENINNALDNGTLEEFLSKIKGISVMPRIFGFQREGVELTERGLIVSEVVNKLFMNEVEEFKKRKKIEENTNLVENQINKKR